MDLVLNNLQRLICHKTQPTNQPIWGGGLQSAYSKPFQLGILYINVIYILVKAFSL